jgi:DNA-binding response OmpR family regulator
VADAKPKTRGDARVLVVEDADAIRAAVESGLLGAGHDVVARPDGRDLERVLTEFRPDLVVLDVMLPGRDGFALLRVVRSHSDAGVVMLTARDGIDDRLRGFDTGADDYVVKPFVLAELVARVGALLRRLGRVHSTITVAGPSRGVGNRLDGDRIQVVVLSRRAPRQGGDQVSDPFGSLGFRRLRRQPR